MTDNNHTDSRDAILARIKAGLPDPVDHPDVPMYDIAGDPVNNFIEKLQSFDGKAIQFPSRDKAVAWLDTNISRDKTVFSSLPDWQGNVSPERVADPRQADCIDICVGQGLLGVGETGSIWVTDESLGKGACALMSTDLYLLLDRATVMSGLHQAYAALTLRDQCYGSYFTGPSATADIEAVRVTGAQGPVSLSVLIYG
ncbi:MAG: LUD domain-containing protein [Pseudoflavonifractor sp.]|nr:LUD domain-containing protein [Pseudoflavonifractor sp.]